MWWVIHQAVLETTKNRFREFYYHDDKYEGAAEFCNHMDIYVIPKMMPTDWLYVTLRMPPRRVLVLMWDVKGINGNTWCKSEKAHLYCTHIWNCICWIMYIEYEMDVISIRRKIVFSLIFKFSVCLKLPLFILNYNLHIRWNLRMLTIIISILNC